MDGNLTRQTDPSFLETLLNNFSNSCRKIGYGTFLYKQRLKGRHPLKLMASPKNPFEGNPIVGASILEDKMSFCGHLVENAGSEIWNIVDHCPKLFREEMHEFGWLSNLTTIADTKRATKRAEDLTKLWLKKNHNWNLPSWKPDIIGMRIINWAFNAPLILSSSDMVYRSHVLNSLAHQSRHLHNACLTSTEGMPRIKALVGLAISGLLIPDGTKRLEKGLSLLKRDLAHFINADGGPVTRNARDGVSVLRLLIYLKTSLLECNQTCPDWVQNTADKIVPFLKCLQHGEGGFASFEGAFAEDSIGLKQIFKLSNAKGKAIENASLSGFLRAKINNTLVLLDTGPPAKPSLSHASHTGTLAFEFSDGKDNVVVNMGGSRAGFSGEEASLNYYSKHTGAHSTLILAGQDIIPVEDTGQLQKSKLSIQFQKTQNEDGSWIEAQHNGYANKFGAIHKRTLFINPEGNDIRGEDELKVTPKKLFGIFEKEVEENYCLHFILHPKVSASPTQDGKAIILRLAHGNGWRFRAKGGEVRMEDALFCEKPGAALKTKRIVVEAIARKNSENKLNWQFKKLEKI